MKILKLLFILIFTIFLIFGCNSKALRKNTISEMQSKFSPNATLISNLNVFPSPKESPIIILFDTSLTKDSEHYISYLKEKHFAPPKKYILKESYDKLDNIAREKYKEYKILDIKNLPSNDDFGFGDGDLSIATFAVVVNPVDAFDSKSFMNQRKYLSSIELLTEYVDTNKFYDMYNKSNDYFSAMYLNMGYGNSVSLFVKMRNEPDYLGDIYKRLEYLNNNLYLLNNKGCDTISVVDRKLESSRFILDIQEPIKTIIFSSLSGANFVSTSSYIFQSSNENLCFLRAELPQ